MSVQLTQSENIELGGVSQRRFAVAESVVAAELDRETVLLDIESGIYFGLDEVGTEIWRLIEAGRDEQEILDELVDAFEVEPDVLRGDVRRFVDRLLEKRLIQAATG